MRQLPNNTNALVAQQAVQAAISRVGSAVDIAAASTTKAESLRPFTSPAERQVYFDAALSSAQQLINNAPPRITETTGNTPDRIQYDPRANSTAGQMITWVFIPLIGLSAMFAYERQTGTLRRILITPTSKATFIAGTVFGQVFIAIVQMLILILFGSLVMGSKLGSFSAGSGDDACLVHPGSWSPGHNARNHGQNRGPGKRIKRHGWHGDGSYGRVLVPDRTLPASHPRSGQNITHHLGNAGHARHRNARSGCVRRLAGDCRPAWICIGILRGRSEAIQVRIIFLYLNPGFCFEKPGFCI